MTQVRPVVLVVEDDGAVRVGIGRLLRFAGLEAREFPSGPAFLAACGPGDGACLLVDAQMPEMDGDEVVRRWRALGARTPVIVVTAYPDGPVARRLVDDGAFALVRKPLDGTVLLSRVREALALPPVADAEEP